MLLLGIMRLINQRDSNLKTQELGTDTLISQNKILFQSGRKILTPSSPLPLDGKKENVLSVKNPGPWPQQILQTQDLDSLNSN
jgi:hypothetical protein